MGVNHALGYLVTSPILIKISLLKESRSKSESVLHKNTDIVIADHEVVLPLFLLSYTQR